MNFYAQDTRKLTYGRTVYAFPTKKLRDFMCSAMKDRLGPCSAAYARKVRRKDEESRFGEWSGYNFLDMRLGEYWWDSFEPLWDETHALGLWG